MAELDKADAFVSAARLMAAGRGEDINLSILAAIRKENEKKVYSEYILVDRVTKKKLLGEEVIPKGP